MKQRDDTNKQTQPAAGDMQRQSCDLLKFIYIDEGGALPGGGTLPHVTLLPQDCSSGNPLHPSILWALYIYTVALEHLLSLPSVIACSPFPSHCENSKILKILL